MERAVRAALAIQRALSEINARNAVKGAPELLARIGLEFGPVVVEEAGGAFAMRRMSPRASRALPSRVPCSSP